MNPHPAIPGPNRARDVAPLAAAAVGLALAGAYAANLVELGRRWAADPNYSHGFLVIPIAAAILWQRRGDLDPARVRPSWLGWLLVVAVLALRAWLFQLNERWFEAATLPLAAAALTLAFGGWYLLRWAAPALAFLWLMLPLPPRVNIVLAGPLQQVATFGSTAILQLMGLPVLSEGNVILIGSERLNVEEACNGLSMLLSFVTLIAATVILLRSRPLWERAVLLLSTVPIALLSNIIRIVVIALCYRWLGREWGHTIGHDWGGYLMMPIALGLVFLELRVLRWIVVEEEVVRGGPRMIIPTFAAPPPGVAKKKPPGPAQE
jgi:exosortase